MPLGAKQELFVFLEAQWVQWVLGHPGWALRHGEGRILPLGANGKGRNAIDVLTHMHVDVQDAVHKANGAHYNGVGADWLLFVNGTNVTRSDAPEWLACGEKWESMNALCRWGGRFEHPPDANHISLEHNGIS